MFCVIVYAMILNGMVTYIRTLIKDVACALLMTRTCF